MPFNLVNVFGLTKIPSSLSIYSKRICGYGDKLEDAELFRKKYYSENKKISIWLQVGEECVPYEMQEDVKYGKLRTEIE